MIVYLNGKYLEKDTAKISPDDRGFLFADGVYEVIRTDRGKPFRVESHVKRLGRSLRELGIRGFDPETLFDIVPNMIRKNPIEGDGLVYIQVTRGVAPRKHSFPDPETPPTVYANISSNTFSSEKYEKGVRVILVPDLRWSRCDIKTVSLLPNAMASQEASEKGAEEALLVRDGAVTEGSKSNFFAVIDGVVRTFPESHYILPGITRKTVMELCAELNIPVQPYPVLEKELKTADECFITGSATKVMPVVRIGEIVIGDGAPGPVTEKLMDAYERKCSA